MEFEFDLNKSKENKQKHGINFQEAQKLWDDPFRVVIPARCSDENRWLMIARIDEQYWSVIYTIRRTNIRIISVRKSRENEKEIYQS